MSEKNVASQQPSPEGDRPCRVSHVADRYRHYPGEDVILSTRVEALETLPGFTLRVAVPAGMLPGDTLEEMRSPPLLTVLISITRYLSATC